MTGRRGRPPKGSRRGPVGRPPKSPVYSLDGEPTRITGGFSPEGHRAEMDDETAVSVEVLQPPKRQRRGRPSAQKEDGEAVASILLEEDKCMVPRGTMKRLASGLPRMENDNVMVTCAECFKAMTFRQFRVHNIQCHANTAPTQEEKGELVMDHKYFARKLNEFKKLTKLTVFACPKTDCGSSFKSTLGLAYHLNTCGRTQEELEAVLLECEICHMKFTLPNMAWHKKTHDEKRRASEMVENSEERTNLSNTKGNKRKSAMIARKSFKRAAAASNDKDGDDNSSSGGSDDDYEVDEDDLTVEPDPLGDSSHRNSHIKKPKEKRKENAQSQSSTTNELESNDYTVLALEFLETLDERGHNAWDDPQRFVEDPFLHLHLSDNSLQAPDQDNIEEYLPDHRTSVEFKCTGTTDDDSSDYHSLHWFEGESVEIIPPPAPSSRGSLSGSIHHAGGPVLSMAWHPSGKFLAVSVAHSYKEELDSLVSQHRKSCVQIYRRWGSALNLQLVLGVDWGYASHIQWSSFCPDIMESYNPAVESCFDDLEIYARLGYLAMLGEDPSVRIFSLGIQDLKVPGNYEYKHEYQIKVYKKTPEIELRIDASVREDEDSPGNAVKFDWHEQNQYLAVGYADGYVAVFDLKTKSPLLMDREGDTVIINPFWVFQGHKLAVRGVVFDPMDSRCLVTGSQDRQMKVWDLLTRSERDNKRTGVCLDMCWVRGWIHQVSSFENLVAYQSASNNYLRVFQTGSQVGKPCSAEIFNVTSLDFYHGLTAQGTEEGKVNCTYYDWYWRECDYERNRRKKNLAVLSSLEVDKNSYEKLSAADFLVQVKRLKQKVVQSKQYQRLGINEDEGVYSVSLEAKFGNMGIFDELPNIDGEEEEDMDDEEEESDDDNEPEENGDQEEESVEGEVAEEKLFKEEKPALDDSLDPDEYSELTMSDAINSAMTTVKDGLVPVYDVINPEGVPRLNFKLARKRPAAAVPNEGLEAHQVEEYIRFHPFLRINKVKWSPSGDVIAVGYRNGLITLLPGNFDSIFPA